MENNKICGLCGNTGYIQIETLEKNIKSITCQRCPCSVGRKLPDYIKIANLEKLKEQYNLEGLVFRLKQDREV